MKWDFGIIFFVLMSAGAVLVGSEPIKTGNISRAVPERTNLIKKRGAKSNSAVVPTTGKIWPPYPFAEQGYWARKSGFYGPVPEKLKDISLLNVNNNKLNGGETPKEVKYSSLDFYNDYSYSSSSPYQDLPSPPPLESTYFSHQAQNSINSLNSLGTTPSPLTDYYYTKDPFDIPYSGSYYEENPLHLSSSAFIPPGKTYYRSLDLGDEGSTRIFLRKEDVYYDKKKYPFYYKPLNDCYPYCKK